MTTLDPRNVLARPDLAEQALEGVLRAERFVAPAAAQCSAPVASVRRAPQGDAEQADQLIFGEAFDVLEERDGYAWGRARRDGYVGWVDLEALSSPVLTPTHRLSAIRAYAFPEPDAKASPTALLSLNALVTVEERSDGFLRCARLGWVPSVHLTGLDAFEIDPVAVAERFLGAPYQWGGRESLGLDCSGLIQQALYACGRACPRDSDQQAAEGSAVDPAALRRGDLVAWTGHIGLMTDETTLIHANMLDMAVAREPLARAVERLKAAGRGEPTGYRRLAAA